MLDILANYYEMVAKATYGAKYIKENPKTKHTIRYVALINNVKVIQQRIKQLKEKKGLSFFNFNNFEIGNIKIKDGFLAGDIEKGEKEAYEFISSFNSNKFNNESLKNYELGLLVLNLVTIMRDSCFAPGSESQKTGQEESKKNSSEESTNSLPLFVETKVAEVTKKTKKNKKPVDIKEKNQISLFPLI